MAWAPQMKMDTVGARQPLGSLAYPGGKEWAGKGLSQWGSTSKVTMVTTGSD